MQGKIIKGIAGFYYVWCEDDCLYECKAKGIFRKDGVKPLVGDDVEIHVLNEDRHLGNIENILPRRNELIRPAVANVDQAMIIFAMAEPMPNLNLLDRFLVMMEWQRVETIICFSKQDIVSEEEEQRLQTIYEKCANRVFSFSNKENTGVEQIKEMLAGKTTVLAGPSGVGKSSLVNRIYPKAESETGEISEKIGRGKHTTRHSELFHIGRNSFLFDTPGFSSLKIPEIPKEELHHYFTEFVPYEGQCRYLGCSHIHEPDCMIKEKLEQGEICQSRYENYIQIFEELAETERRKNWRNRK
ncbi:MAG: ribosome small subunit-dependent GTPase A [Lachnospiraceae bacterium]|nr:ribosome small subunit-dependent GTPase A [Lachnospiraceae bacterium]